MVRPVEVAVGSTRRETVSILSVPVDTLISDELTTTIQSMLCSSETRVRHIVTYNPEYAMAARRDPAFLAALQAADIVTADGVGIVVAGRLHRHAKRLSRISGVDVLGLMARVSQESGDGIFLLGARPEVAPKAANALKELMPQANFCGWWWNGTPSPTDDAATIERIRESGARMLAVAYGAPAQIHWIARNLDSLSAIGIRIVVGVGGALDYWGGEAKRPPKLVQKLGFEWLFRLVREPWRWRRQLVLPGFAVLATIEAARTWLPSQAKAQH